MLLKIKTPRSHSWNYYSYESLTATAYRRIAQALRDGYQVQWNGKRVGGCYMDSGKPVLVYISSVRK